MDDLVSRQVAIEEFVKHCYPVRYNYNSVESGMTLTGIKQVINEMPSAQPEIIRCKDCARYVPSESEFEKGTCDGRQVSKRHFCGYAKRRANDGK